MKKIIIAIDGYSACGKSTTAKKLAKKLNYAYVDSGAMYRAVTLYFQQHHISISNPKQVEKALEEIHIEFKNNPVTNENETYLNKINVEKEIRTLEVAKMVSEVAAISAVRKEMVEQQKKMGKHKGIIMDGRDIGTKVFPDAELKIFMTADKVVRAERRQKELLEKGDVLDLAEIIKNIEHRDLIDSTRKESPLIQANDAWLLDNTKLTMDQQLNIVLDWVDSKIKEMEQLTTESNELITNK